MASGTTGVLLDVGAGDGLLVSRLSQLGRNVVGVELDKDLANSTKEIFADSPQVEIVAGDFLTTDLKNETIGFISIIATLHHMNSELALERCKALLQPGGVLFIIGIAKPESARDWLFSAISVPFARFMGILRQEHWPPNVSTTSPLAAFGEIRSAAEAVLSGAQIRRRRLFRYSLVWRKPLNLAQKDGVEKVSLL